MLCADLRLSGIAGVPFEYLQPTVLFSDGARGRTSRIVLPKRRRSYRALSWASRRTGRDLPVPFGPLSRRSVEAYLRRVAALRTTPNGVFAIKLHGSQMDAYVGTRSEVSLECLGVPITWIYLVRDDSLGQAISWQRALETQRWTGHEGDEPPATYDRAAIADRLDRIERGNALWASYFDRHQIDPLEVHFEDYVADRRAGIERILRRANLGTASFDLATTQKQSDGLSADWRRRFLDESRQDAAEMPMRP
jgi:LPS sulfotransferase NodH